MTNDQLAQEVASQFKTAKEFFKGLSDRRRNNWELYTGNNPQSKVENVDNIKTHVPYTQTLVDNVHPLLTSKLPIGKVSPRDSEKNYAAAKLMDRLCAFTSEVNGFDEKFVDGQMETIYAADAFYKVIWSPDPEKNYPEIIHTNTDEIIPHINKIYIDDDWPLFQRREMTKQQMKEEKGWDKDEIDSLGPSKLGTKAYRRQQMERLGVGTTPAEDNSVKDDLYEVVERWSMMDFDGENSERKMGCVVVANNGEKILNPKPYDEDLEPFESPYANNVMPYAQLKYKRVPHSFFSISMIDPIAPLQVELNDLEDMKKVNYYRRNNPPMLVDRGANVDLSTLKWLAGLPWMTDRMSGVQIMSLPDLAATIENDKMSIKRDMQNATGANDVLLATPEMMTKGGTISATQSALVNEQTKVHFKPQAFNIDKCVERVFKLVMNLWQDKRFFNKEVTISIADEDNLNQIQKVSHSQVQGDLDYIVTSASSLANSDQTMLNTAVQLRELYAQDQSKNMEPVDQVIWDKAGFDYSKIKKTTAEQLPQVIMKLKQLTAIAQRPDFKNMPPKDQQQVQQSIQQLTMVAKGLQQKTSTQEMPSGQSSTPEMAGANA